MAVNEVATVTQATTGYYLRLPLAVIEVATVTHIITLVALLPVSQVAIPKVFLLSNFCFIFTLVGLIVQI